MNRLVRHAALAAWIAAAGARAAGAAEIAATATGADGAPLADVVVVAMPLDSPLPPPPASPPRDAIVQVDKQFVPYVKPVRAGTEISFPNRDDVHHHVYSFSPAKRFELPLYAGTPAEPIVFDEPGIVTLGCNIHDWMIAYIYVVETPWFAKTGADGKAAIGDLPAGRYRVHAWHPRMASSGEATAREVTLAEGAPHEARWQLELEAELRGRRAPLPATGSY